MAGVWVLAETEERMFELLGLGKELSKQLGCKLFALAWGQQDDGRRYIEHGADEVMLMDPPGSDQPLIAYVPVIAEEARNHDPDVILVAATARGKELAARLASALGTGLVSECTSFRLREDGKTFDMERMVFGGAAVQTVTCVTRPQMATIPPRCFSKALPESGRQGEIRVLPAPPSCPVRVVDKKPRAQQAGNIEEARVVICVGRGLEKEEDLKLVRDLAEVVGGEIACTRPLAEELKWLPEETYVGLSGKKVKPDLYVGVGVSGQVQHTTGIRDAKIICAINKDENAPIFSMADLGIVGDLYQVLPELTKQLREAIKR
ncbi:MAG TPA: electron transfer flavoprotein subunit alpha/FixB family protein [Syntrophothermus lipocalidus]|uniref:Electron transfer flavoprotein alpha subunit n=1 Tax=Syntrophothermus lipocalidus (strain DSM 12680 / TGB-C1) TaxID=643648 RepID=D7CLS1_SYNLT|nr:electron transfer flavoprotein subunit alpha/FixB family protein [Syntrophothermus lipocalidus]ADI01656.1 Electron transfer flavoprotein alpha subunit [Syntrophothermus lipocalidus DSM 12680]HHV77053.1 electron transfer flavoprotein subunit alpha/FixB family protein [Syntrophothermus lipocalidus]